MLRSKRYILIFMQYGRQCKIENQTMFVVNADGSFTVIQTTIYRILMVTESMQQLRRHNHLQREKQKEVGSYVTEEGH